VLQSALFLPNWKNQIAETTELQAGKAAPRRTAEEEKRGETARDR
jgi:hypothetical protein